MKKLLIELTDEEYEKLLKVKGHKTWREVILSLIPKSKEELLVHEINAFYEKIQSIDPNNYEIYELLRVTMIMLIKGNIEITVKMLNKCLEVLSSKFHK